MKTTELIGPALDWAVAKCVSRGYPYPASTDWSVGGPIIERERIALRCWLECGWEADKWNFKFAEGSICGPTPLIAAMRCFVASKLGDAVEVPEELK